jgi:hypothetical protein
MFRRKVRFIGDEMLHRFGAGRDRSSARLCAAPQVGDAAAWTADLGLLLRDYGT